VGRGKEKRGKGECRLALIGRGRKKYQEKERKRGGKGRDTFTSSSPVLHKGMEGRKKKEPTSSLVAVPMAFGARKRGGGREKGRKKKIEKTINREGKGRREKREEREREMVLPSAICSLP